MQIILSILKFIFSLGLPIIAGYIVCIWLLSNRHGIGLLQKLAFSYGIGMGILSLVMFLLSLLKVRFGVLSITISLAIVVMPFLFLCFKSKDIFNKQTKMLQRKQLSFSRKLLIGLILCVFLFVLFQALIVPLAAWDSWAIYGFKAKAFYLDKTVQAGFLKDTTKFYSHPDYPLLVPLAETWIYICLGTWNDQLVKILFPLYFISLIIIFYNNLKYYIDKKYSLLFAFFFVTIPQVISLGSSGYADLPLAFYYFTSLAFLIRGCEDFDKTSLFFSAIFAGLAAWTKNEGIVMAMFDLLIFLGVILVRRKMSRKNILLIVQYGLIIALIAGPWIWFKNSLGLANDVVNSNNLSLGNIIANLNRIPIVLTFMAKQVFSINSWNLLFMFSVVVIIFNFKRVVLLPNILVFLSLLFYVCVWIFIYVISPYDIKWHLGTSLNRLLLQITALLLFLDALLIFQSPES